MVQSFTLGSNIMCFMVHTEEETSELYQLIGASYIETSNYTLDQTGHKLEFDAPGMEIHSHIVGDIMHFYIAPPAPLYTNDKRQGHRRFARKRERAKVAAMRM